MILETYLKLDDITDVLQFKFGCGDFLKMGFLWFFFHGKHRNPFPTASVSALNLGYIGDSKGKKLFYLLILPFL